MTGIEFWLTGCLFSLFSDEETNAESFRLCY